jgi:hypothetical protein
MAVHTELDRAEAADRLALREDGDRKIMIASLRYLDTFARIDRSWYFAERNLILDWSETRPLGTDEES